MTRRKPGRALLAVAAAGFLGCIVAANVATSHYGLVPVGFGLVATAGTFAAGATFVIRDTIDDLSGRTVVLTLIAIGAATSALLGDGRIALASGVAFMLSELADYAVYRPLRRRGYVQAAVASNVAGAFIDTVLFLAVAGFPILPALPGQMVGKLAVTAATVLGVWIFRAVLRKPLDSESA